MKSLLQMPPQLPSCNSMYLRLPYVKYGSDSMLRHCSKQPSNFYDLRFAKLGAAMLRSSARGAKSNSVSVKLIFLDRAPLKIVGSIVCFIAINVIDLMVRSGRQTDKRFRHKTMNWAMLLSVFGAYSRSQIPSTIDAQTKQSMRPFNRPRLAQIRNLVCGFIPHNCAPNLVHPHLHHRDTLACHNLSQLVHISK